MAGTLKSGGIESPFVLYGKPFNWKAGDEAMGQVQREDGSINWQAAFAADPGTGRCPKCRRWLWREGLFVRCPHVDCGCEFGWPNVYQQRQINGLRLTLLALAQEADGIDNGACKLCGSRRVYQLPAGRRSGHLRPGPCENRECLSHRIATALDLDPRTPEDR